jgi:hypothetical protein
MVDTASGACDGEWYGRGITVPVWISILVSAYLLADGLLVMYI